MKYNLLLIIVGVFIFLLLGLLMLFKSADAKNLQITEVLDENIELLKSKIKNNNSWYISLSNDDFINFYPITNELYLHFELQESKYISKKKFYKLNIDKHDSYSLFCVKQTINNLKLKFFLITNKKYSQILIDTDNVSLLHYLIENLKKYRINSEFEEIWI